MNQLPNREIIIIGGGAVGCGVAYALAKAGKTDVLLIERADDVGQVTTSQGAGLCGQVRGTAERIKLAMHSVAVFRDLQKSDVNPDWHEVGSLRIALSDKRAEEFRSLKQAADDAGLDARLIDTTEAKHRWPLMDFAAVKSGHSLNHQLVCKALAEAGACEVVQPRAADELLELQNSLLPVLTLEEQVA